MSCARRLVMQMTLILFWSSFAYAVPVCSITASQIHFGTYIPLDNATIDITGTISVRCTSPAPTTVHYSIMLSRGNNLSYSPRTLFSGPSAIGYNLYVDSARTAVFGEGVSGTAFESDSYSFSGVVSRSYPIYARISARQNVPPGSYSDTITVAVDYW